MNKFIFASIYRFFIQLEIQVYRSVIYTTSFPGLYPFRIGQGKSPGNEVVIYRASLHSDSFPARLPYSDRYEIQYKGCQQPSVLNSIEVHCTLFRISKHILLLSKKVPRKCHSVTELALHWPLLSHNTGESITASSEVSLMFNVICMPRSDI